MRKTSFYFGVISGILLVLSFITPYLIYGNEFETVTAEKSGYVLMILCMTLVFFGIKSFRDKKNGGMIGFGQALGLGSEISGISGLIFGIYTYILYKFISPGLSGKMAEYYKNRIINSGKSQEVIALRLKEINAQADLFGNPIAMAIVMTLTIFAIGLLVSLISVLILKKKQSKSNNQNTAISKS